MLDVFIDYNPYKVETKVTINGTPVTEQSPLYNKMHGQRLQSWIEPQAHWEGIFQELRRQGESEVLIRFHGTALDYADLEYARDRYGSVFSRVEMEHVNRESCKQDNPSEKLKQLQKLYEELQNGPIDEFKSEDIQTNFKNAMNSDFEIVVVAPMSSGKSTLINAILGQDLLPAINQATTATIAKIRAVNDPSGNKDFTVTAKLPDGSPVRFLANPDGSFAEDEKGNYTCSAAGKAVENVPATPKLIKELNYLKNPASPEKALVDTMWINGPIETITGSGKNSLDTVLIDTPGGNNSANKEHGAVMRKAICNENKSLILYVFNGTQTGTNDSDDILKLIAEEMKSSSGGKQSRDRFLFVANRMDDIDTEKESYESYQVTIGDMLRGKEIEEPNLFFVSSQLAKLIRVQRAGQKLSKAESAFIEGKKMLFGDISDGDDSRCLYKYSSISDRQKAEYDEKLANLTDPYRISEINSGMPALEAAIREYVDKYAISIKLKSAHDSFMGKVKYREMEKASEARWVSSQDELNKVRKEIAEKQKKHKEDKKLLEYREKIRAIKLDVSPIRKVESRLQEEADIIRSRYKDAVKKENATAVVMKFKGDLETCLKKSWQELVRSFNDGVIATCNQTIEGYQSHIKALENSGLFNLGGIRIAEMEDFRELNIGSPRELLGDEKYMEVREEVVGTRTYEKSGLFNKFKRLFGFKSGWGTENIIEDVEYVKVSSLVEDIIGSIVQKDYIEEIEEQRKEVEKEIDRVKEVVYEKLNALDAWLSNVLDEINQKISDEQKLKTEVAANKENLDWMRAFIKKMDMILEIE